MNNDQYTVLRNVSNLRVFLRHNVMQESSIVNILASCLRDRFVDNKIEISNGLHWSIVVPKENCSDIALYKQMLNDCLLSFFNNGIVKSIIKERISENDRAVYYDLFHKFQSGMISPVTLIDISFLPSNGYGLLMINF